MIDGREKEGAELPFARIDLRQIVLTQQPRKELLSQALGVLGAVSSPADVSVEGIPVGAAQLLQGLGGLGRLALSRRQHHASMGRGEKPRDLRRRLDSIAGAVHDGILAAKIRVASTCRRPD